MDFKTIPDVAKARADALTLRQNQLELEYLSNEAALVAAQALPAGESRDTEVKRLQTNLAVLEDIHKVVSAEIDKKKPKAESFS